MNLTAMGQVCYKCGGKLTEFAYGLNRKLINRGIQDFLCMDCLATHFQVSVADLNVMARHFQEAGCQLFPPLDLPERQVKTAVKRKRLTKGIKANEKSTD